MQAFEATAQARRSPTGLADRLEQVVAERESHLQKEERSRSP